MKNLIPVLLCLTTFAVADTGMWMPHQINSLNLKEQGLEIDSSELLKPDGTGLMNAIVKFGGATGEFISKDGLLLTNHHVAFGAVQRASDTEHDYIKDGFLAASQTNEIQAPGMYADILLEYTDVTETINKRLTSVKNYRKQYDALDKIKKELVAQAEKAGPDIRAYVKNMYSGNQYYLFIVKRLEDIRLVCIPPRSLGNFGGDIDNWMWPRHTCDFSFLRAYVSPSGEGKPYSPDNVPFQPKSFLKISTAGFNEGDLTFVMGYPGKTFRNYSAKEVELDIEKLQQTITTYQSFIHFIEDASAGNREIEIKYAGKHKSLNNALKNYTGKLEGFDKADLLAKKQKAEAELLEHSPAEMRDQLKLLNTFLEKEAQEQKLKRELEHVVSNRYSSTLLDQAFTVLRTVQERTKPDMKRDQDYQERNIPEKIKWLRLAERSYDIDTDKAFLKFRLKQMQQLDEKYIPNALKDVLQTDCIEDFVDNLFAKTRMGDAEKCIELMSYTPKQLAALNDPMIELAAGIEDQLKTIREEEKSKSMQKQALKKKYLAAMLAWKNNAIAPDANSSIRLTFGNIAGYSPRDAVYYTPQTTLSGVLAKEQAEYPFSVPA